MRNKCCKKLSAVGRKKTTAKKKAATINFYHQYYNSFNFMQPISPSTYNSNPVAASTPISTSNEQNLRQEKQEHPRDKRDKRVAAQTHQLWAMWKENIQGIESGK